jgi:hypothetical protein
LVGVKDYVTHSVLSDPHEEDIGGQIFRFATHEKIRAEEAQDGKETTMFRQGENDGRRVIALRWKFEDWMTTDWFVV